MKALTPVPLPAGFAALLTDPAVPGAACRVAPADHDPRGEREPDGELRARHARAIHRCTTCPALARCQSALPHLDGALTGFVVAGAVVERTT